MDNKRNPKECKEPSIKGKEQKEKEFQQALAEGMDRYDEALRHLADR